MNQEVNNLPLVKRALETLSLWGECVYFSQPEELAGTVILHPDFLTKEVMAKLFNPTFCSTFDNGIVKHFDLQGIWSKYPASLCPTLLALMGDLMCALNWRTHLMILGKGAALCRATFQRLNLPTCGRAAATLQRMMMVRSAV